MTDPTNKLYFVAKSAHEINRTICRMVGDNSQPAWKDAEKWQRDSVVDGVRAVLFGHVKGPGDAHRRWMKQKLDNGWKYGPVKDPKKKEHPSMVPFDDLPQEEQLKDHLFFQTVTHMLKSDFPK